MTTCPHQDEVDAFVSGRLSPDDRPRVESHLTGCPSCNHLTTLLLGKPGEVPADPQPEQPTHTSGDPSAPRSHFPPRRGQSVGRYVVLDRLGSGGMGSVFAAYDTVLDRKVALKFLTAAGPRAVGRLIEEASLMAKLQHHNVVTVYDVGRFDQAPYLAMELVDGQDLSRWRLERSRSVREIVTVMAAAARGLAAAHAAGIVHRDVKPQNILVAGARVLVTDFGISVREQEQRRRALRGHARIHGARAI